MGLFLTILLGKIMGCTIKEILHTNNNIIYWYLLGYFVNTFEDSHVPDILLGSILDHLMPTSATNKFLACDFLLKFFMTNLFPQHLNF
jgi:hypothetical protein